MKPQTHTQRRAAIGQPGYPREETLHTWLSKLPQGRFLSDCTSSQTDLRPRLEQLSKGTFSDVATQMIKSLGCVVVLADDECGGSYSSSFGVLMSPNYPEAYSHDEFCVWIIIVNDTDRVTFTMMELDLEDDTDCRLDYVEVTSNVLHNERIISAYAANASQDRLDLHVIIIANRINKFYRIYCQTEKNLIRLRVYGGLSGPSVFAYGLKVIFYALNTIRFCPGNNHFTSISIEKFKMTRCIR